MRLWLATLAIVLWACAALSAPPGRAPRADAPGDGRELREALRDYFQQRMRNELELTDEQSAAVVPLVESLESVRRYGFQERQAAMRRLRRAMSEGAGDAKLEELLEDVDRIERRQRTRERALLVEIDEHLSARQRVEFREFVDRFRREMRRRVDELRREGPGRRGDRPRPR